MEEEEEEGELVIRKEVIFVHECHGAVSRGQSQPGEVV